MILEELKIDKKDKLLIFDLDDTLIISDAKIKILDNESKKVIKELTPDEYNYYVQKDTHMLNFDDFMDFGILKKAKLTKYMSLLKKEYKKGTCIAILTARENSDLISNFFKYHKINLLPQLVIATGDPKWELQGNVDDRKQSAIRRLIKHGYKNITFFDDNKDNIIAANKLSKDYTDVSIKTVKVSVS